MVNLDLKIFLYQSSLMGEALYSEALARFDTTREEIRGIIADLMVVR
jgi:hypothetical protein